jgi:hypothetical protein
MTCTEARAALEPIEHKPGMWVMNVNGSSPTLVPFTQTEGGVYGPSMSAAGSSVVFTKLRTNWTRRMVTPSSRPLCRCHHHPLCLANICFRLSNCS